jgi:hypothetical protein
MTARFESEISARGRDWSNDEYSDGAIAFTYEQIAPDESLVESRVVSPHLRQKITNDFLASDSRNAIVFYPLFEGEISPYVIES